MRTKVGLLLTILVLTLPLSDSVLVQLGAGDRGGEQGRQPSQRERSPDSRQGPDQEMRRPVLLRGRVVLADGSPLPGSVNVELVCLAPCGSRHPLSAMGILAFKWVDAAERLSPTPASAALPAVLKVTKPGTLLPEGR